MSENTRLDIDSNIPQEMDKISKAADLAAKRLEALSRNPVSALEELRKALTNIHTGASAGVQGTEDLFNKMVAVIRSSSAPTELRKMYDQMEKQASKHHRRMLELQEDLAYSENQLKEANEGLDKARRQKKNSSEYRAAKASAEASIGILRERYAEEDKLTEQHIRKAQKLYEKINEAVRQSSPSGPGLSTGENAVGVLEQARKAVEGHYNSLGIFISQKSEELRKANEKFMAKALLLDTGEVRKYTAQAQQALAGHYDSLGNFVSNASVAAADKLKEANKAAARALLFDTGEVRKYTAQAQQALAGHYDSLGNFIQKQELKRHTLDAATYKSIKAQVEAATASGIYSDISTKQMQIPDALAPGLIKTGSALPGLSKGFRKLGDDMGYAHSFARGLASGFNLLWLTWGKLAPLFAGASISYGVAKTFQFGSEIEYNIRFLETLGDLTRTQGKVIREELRKMDESTMFSMTELSKAMLTLSQSGYAAKESLKLTKTSADLATVGMTDMATSTDLLMQVMKLFGKTASDADKVASQLYEATKVSAMNISDLGESFKYASVAGLAYNQTLEGTLAGYAALSEGGIKKSMAGTSFINLLQDLSGRSKKSIDAMETLRKKTGETIKIFDDTGKMRNFADIVFEIDKAVKMFDPTKQMKLVNDIFTERGIREYFALIGVGKERVDELVKSLEKVDPAKAFNAARNMQDTVKAGFEMMKSTLTGSLDRVFEANSGKFREFFTGMTELIGSKEFINSVNLMVNAFSGLYETLKVVGPALLVVGGGFLAMKSVAMVQTGVASLTTAFGTLIPVLAQSRGSFLTLASSSISSATAVQGQGLALLQTGVMARGAAGGIEAAAVASALTATSATKAVPAIRALAIVMGFLTNPIVGVITTLGILGATWWATSRDSMTASEQLSNKVVENGKVNVKALNEEIAKLLEINAIRTQKSPIADMLPKAEADAKAAYATVSKLQATYDSMVDGPAKENLARQLAAQREKAKNSVETWQELTKGQKKYLDGIAAQERAAELERDKKIREAQAKPPGTIDPNTPDGGTSSNRSFDQYASSLTRQLAALKTKTAEEKQMAQARMTETEALYKREIDLVEAKNKAGMLSEGEYQIAVIQTTQQAEAAKISLLEEAKKKVSEANLAELAQQQKIQGKALTDFKGTKEARQDLIDSYAEKVEAIQKQEVADTATYNAEIEKIKQESLFRIENASINHQGKLIKLQKEADKYLADLKGERSKEAAVAALNKQYENVNDSSVIWLQAEKAAAMAAAEAVGKHEAQLRESAKAYEEVAKTEADMREKAAAYEKAGMAVPGVNEAVQQIAEQRMALEKRNAAERVALEKDVANQSAIAYNEAFRKRSNEFKNTLAQTLADALISGANDGGQNLRKILENELKAPFVLLFRMSIDALMGDLSSAVGSATGGTGSGGASSVMSSLSTASTLNTAYKALSGAIEGSIGKSFEKFALSDMGAKFGMSTSNGVVPVFEYSASGELTAVGDSLTANTKAVTEFGKTFTDIGTGIAAAFAGQALRKGISGGYSVGGAGETLMDVSAMVASYFGPIASIVTGAVSGLINRTFGRKLKDTGIQGTFAGSEFKGENYQYFKGGWFSSDKTKTSAMDSEAVNTFTNTFRSIQASTAVLATNMGLSAQSALDFKKDIKLSLKDLDPAAQSEAITKMFTEVQEEMATAVLDAWGDWSLIAKYGETASEVLTNVSNNLTGFNGMLDLLDLKLIDLTMNGAAAASAVIEAAGGVEALTGIYSSYYENFYSEAERNSKSIETLGEKFAALGVTFPTLTKDVEGFVTNGDEAREVFRGLVSAAANAGNITLATELVKLSDAFAEVTPLAEEFLKGLKDESKSLEAEFLKAQGNLAGYAAAIRAIETVDMTSVEIATYDYNKQLENYIELLGQADEARTTASEAEIRLLEAQGNKTAALVKQRELDIKGLSEAQAAAYDYAAAIDRQIESMEKLSAAQDSVAASDIKLLQAQGSSALALAKQRELDIRSMTRAEVAAYDYSNAIDDQISKLEQAADIASKLGNVSSDLSQYLKEFDSDTAGSFYKTIGEALSGDMEAMGRITSEADKAIESARGSSRTSTEFAARQAGILAKVRNVRDFANATSQETDAEKLLAAVKATTNAVDSLGTRLSSQDIAVSLNATLESIRKTSGSEADISAIENLFAKMQATVAGMGMTYAASNEGQKILSMFESMRATVLSMTLNAPASEIEAVTNTFSAITGTVSSIRTAEGVLPSTISAITSALTGFQAVISHIAINSQDSNIRSLLLGTSSEMAYGLSLSAAVESGSGNFGMSAEQVKSLLDNSQIIRSLAVVAGTDGTLTTAQQQAYADASTEISKAISVVRGTDASNLTEAQKVLLGVLSGSSNGKVTVGGVVDYAPSTELDELMTDLADALGRVGIEKMTTELGRLVAALDQQRLATVQATQTPASATSTPAVGSDSVKWQEEVALTQKQVAIADAYRAWQDAKVSLESIPNNYKVASIYAPQREAAQAAVTAAQSYYVSLGGTAQFATGGYTGAGGVNEVAGIVHKGEVVWSQSDITKAGGVDTVEAMRKGFMPYAQDIPAPAVVYNTTQSTITFDDSALLEELQSLREEVSNLRYEARATVVNTGNSNKLLKDFRDRGMTVKTDSDTPLAVTTQ